jgi:hypothetical protein
LETLGFPWILSTESSLFKGLRRIFDVLFFVGVLRRRGGRFKGLEIVDEAVDLVEQPLPLLWAVSVLRHNRLLMPVVRKGRACPTLATHELVLLAGVNEPIV